MSDYYVGFDVHSKRTTYMMQDAMGQVLGRGEIATTRHGLKELKEKHKVPDGTQVGLETGTVSFFVARQLRELGLEPVVIDAHEVRLKAHRPMQKSDRRDAEEICEGLRRGIYRSIVHVPPVEIGVLRETLSRRRHFVRAQTSEINAAKRLLRACGLGILSRHLGTETGWQKLINGLEAGGALRQHVEAHHAMWRCAGEQVAALEKKLDAQAAPFANQEALVRTIDGVGRIVALTTIAVFSDITRFKNAKKAASYVGIVPSTYQSGERDAHGRITGRGSSELRCLLVQSAHHASHSAHPLHPYFTKLCAKQGYKRAVVAVGHRLCRILFAMLRDKVPFDFARAGLERGPFESKRVKMYRLKPYKNATTV